MGKCQNNECNNKSWYYGNDGKFCYNCYVGMHIIKADDEIKKLREQLAEANAILKEYMNSDDIDMIPLVRYLPLVRYFEKWGS